MTFITNYNLKKIIFNANLKNVPYSWRLYKRSGDFFNNKEKKDLFAIQEFLNDPENFFYQIYSRRKIKNNVDTYTKVSEGGNPAYHSDYNCERLHSNYYDVTLPENIHGDKEKAIRFRKWYNENSHRLDYAHTENTFYSNLKLVWGVDSLDITEVVNSGFTKFNNLSIPEIETEIDKLISNFAKWHKSLNKDEVLLILKYKTTSFLADRYEPLEKNFGLSDQKAKEILLSYHKQFKRPLFELLLDYYRVQLNPDLDIHKKILDELGFIPCSCCIKKN